MRTQPRADLTYGREGYKSLDKKAGGWGELVGFLNQDIKAHLGKKKQKKYEVLQPPVGGRGTLGKEQRVRGTVFPCSFTPDPRLQSSSVAIKSTPTQSSQLTGS